MSYLTPDWLMQDIGQLTKGPKLMTLDEFMADTHKGEMTGDFFGLYDRRKVYEYQSKDYGEQKHYGYGDPTDMYDLYLQDMGTTWNDAYIDKYHVNQPKGKTYNPFDTADFLSGVERAEGIDPSSESKHDPEMFTSFTPDMFKKLRTEYYQPELEEKRGSLIDDLMGKQKRAKDVGGVFAGYGGREAAGRSVEEDYRGGVKDIYTGIEQQKAQGLQSIYDVLGQYEDLT